MRADALGLGPNPRKYDFEDLPLFKVLLAMPPEARTAILDRAEQERTVPLERIIYGQGSALLGSKTV